MAEQEKYANYSFEDFLQDKFFIESVKRPTEESVVFWNHFIVSFPEQMEVYGAARKFIEDAADSQISDEGVSEIWATIQMRIKSARKWSKVQKTTCALAAVAASIAVLIVVRELFFYDDNQHEQSDIISFISSQKDTISHSGEIQLKLSEQKTVVLEGKESVITYDSAEIQTNTVKIPKHGIAPYNQLVIPNGKHSVLTLHDGTKIWINAGTKLVYPVEFEKNKREIYVNGEIFLDVASDAQWPFFVRTNDLCIQVIGTKFNVQAYSCDEISRIALESGSVRIKSAVSDDILLSPNKIYDQDKSGHFLVKDADIEKYTSWIHGLYIYESERLAVILKRLERYYGIKIAVDSSASELRCSGKLDLKDNVEDVLSIISKTAPVEYIKDSEKYAVNYRTKKYTPMN